MKSYRFVAKALITTVIVCLSPIPTRAHLRTPENVPITFYGKVIDQNGQPVEDAKVSLLVVISHLERLDTEQKSFNVETDQNGDFTVTGFIANAIDAVSITKEGYKLSTKAERTFVFGSIPTYTPDPRNPVVFRMWKENGKEPLINSLWRGKVACDGSTNRFDLLSGTPNDHGNLEIACTRTPLNYVRTNGPSFSYKFEIAIIGGGVQMTSNEFTYLAPVGGYLPIVTIEKKPGDPQWKAGVDREFYIKTVDGRYGCISVMWDAGHRPAPTILNWNCSINPSGSRDLER